MPEVQNWARAGLGFRALLVKAYTQVMRFVPAPCCGILSAYALPSLSLASCSTQDRQCLALPFSQLRVQACAHSWIQARGSSVLNTIFFTQDVTSPWPSEWQCGVSLHHWHENWGITVSSNPNRWVLWGLGPSSEDRSDCHLACLFEWFLERAAWLRLVSLLLPQHIFPDPEPLALFCILLWTSPGFSLCLLV